MCALYHRWIDLSEEKPSVAQVLNRSRSVVIALLGVPVLGMLIAVVVIYIKKPNNMVVVFGVILFVGVQYILMMFFLMKKVEAMAERDDTARTVETEEKPKPPGDEFEERDDQLDPEEKRIFPVEEDAY
jgi:phosphotransferase system  glucose/maltose/N-acetylglucosamine-specific IIC component